MGKRRESFKAVQRSVVRVKDASGQTWGTGFFISREGHLLTCAHVVKDAGDWKNVRILDQPVNCLYEGDPERDDFCLLQVKDLQVTPVELGKDFEPGDEFLSFGFSNDDFYGAPIQGKITDSARCGKLGDQELVRLETFSDAQRIEGGQSGAPVLRCKQEKYYAIGLVVASEDLQGGLAISSEVILNKLSHLISSKQKHSKQFFRYSLYSVSIALFFVISSIAIHITNQSSSQCSVDGITNYYDQITDALGHGQEKKAFSYADELVLKCPSSYLAYLYRGRVFARSSKMDEAILDFQQATELNEKSSEAKYNLGTAYIDSNRYEEAVEVLKSLLQDSSQLDPKSSLNVNDIRFQLGYSYHYAAWKTKVKVEDKISYLERARNLYQQVIDNTSRNCCSGDAVEDNCCPKNRALAADNLGGANAILYSITTNKLYLKAALEALDLGLESKPQAQRINDLKLIESGIKYDIQQQINLIRSTAEFSKFMPKLKTTAGL